MRLPEGFPHTRREQYLVALPDDLLTSDEGSTVMTVLVGVRRYYDARLAKHFADRLPPRPSEEDVVFALAAMFGPLWREDRWRRGPLARRAHER